MEVTTPAWAMPQRRQTKYLRLKLLRPVSMWRSDMLRSSTCRYKISDASSILPFIAWPIHFVSNESGVNKDLFALVDGSRITPPTLIFNASWSMALQWVSKERLTVDQYGEPLGNQDIVENSQTRDQLKHIDVLSLCPRFHLEKKKLFREISFNWNAFRMYVVAGKSVSNPFHGVKSQQIAIKRINKYRAALKRVFDNKWCFWPVEEIKQCFGRVSDTTSSIDW